MPGTPEKDTFDLAKNYTKVQFIRERPLVDFELNEAQDILRSDVEEVAKTLFGNGAVGDGLKVVSINTSNAVLIHPGVLYHNGKKIRLDDFETVTVAAPSKGRKDIIVLDYSIVDIDSTDDANIISSEIGQETATRKKLLVEFSAISSFDTTNPNSPTIPNPSAGVTRIPLAEIRRYSGVTKIEKTNITDLRQNLRNTHLVSGGRAYNILGKIGSLTAAPAHPTHGLVDGDLITINDGSGSEVLEIIIPPGTLTLGNIGVNLLGTVRPASEVKDAIISALNTTSLLDITPVLSTTVNKIYLVAPETATTLSATLANSSNVTLSLEAFQSSNFILEIEQTQVRVAGVEYTIPEQKIVLQPNTAQTYWIDSLGALKNASNMPTDGYKVPLFRVTTDATDIISIDDLRLFPSEYQKTTNIVEKAAGTLSTFSESYFREHNTDGTHKPEAAVSGDISKANIIDLRVDPQDTPDLTVYVNPGDFPKQAGAGTNRFLGSNSPSWAAILPPSGLYRKDLLVITDTLELQILQGEVEAPTAGGTLANPYPLDKAVLAEILVHSSTTELTEDEIFDARGWVNTSIALPRIAGSRASYLFGDKATHTINDYAKIIDGQDSDVSYAMPSPGTLVSLTYSARELPDAFAYLTAIEMNVATGLRDGDTITITKTIAGVNTTYVFEFDTDSSINPANIQIGPLGASDSAALVAAAIVSAINSAGIGVGAAIASGTSIELVASYEFKLLSEDLQNAVTLSTTNFTGGERLIIQRNNIDTAALLDINTYSTIKGSKELEDLGIRFEKGDCFSIQYTNDGSRTFSNTEDLSVTLYVAFDGYPVGSERLREIHIAGPAPNNRYHNLTTGSYKRGNGSLFVTRNGKLLTAGDEYWERSPTAVEFTYVLTEGDVLKFEVIKPYENDQGEPTLREIQIASSNQQLFELTKGAYRPNRNEIQVYRNGKILISGIDFLEVGPISIRLVGYNAQAGDVFQFVVI